MATGYRLRAAIVILALHAPAAPAQEAQTAAIALTPAQSQFDLARPEILAFVQEVASRNESLDQRSVLELLGKAAPQPRILELISRPAERVSPWWEYRARFLNEQRIAEGARFWEANRKVLERVSRGRGVPPEYIVAIIGVETLYGRITGGFRVLDALATLAFDYPPRSDYFRRELEQFMLLAREEPVDPLSALGSYAGAMGAPQFMPSSYRRYAVDGGTDQRRDLWTAWDDVIASVANYFREHGWETGAPVLAEVELDPDPTFTIDTRNLELNETVDSLRANGVRVLQDAPGDTPTLLVFAERPDGPAYRVGFRNFQVITHYNRSARYAMAVHELAHAIAARVPPAPPAAPAPAPETEPPS
ncbi:MAG TPA: lytic murein transglycosylase B [Steroidobacteraceae bacterium]|nr:lytic murein transglycosylase B [Steroidobacteraceae bacterium]